MVKKYVLLCIVLFTALVFSPAPGWSEESSSTGKPHKWLKELGILTGFGSASIDEYSDYEVIPILPRFGFDITPLLHVKKGLLEFVTEPLINVVISPDTNAEVGCSFFLKYSGHITPLIAPYIEGGVGGAYTTQHTHEQGTQFNFLPQAGVGVQCFHKKNIATTIGYRYRHMSNAGISDDNRGIDHHFALFGISYFFE